VRVEAVVVVSPVVEEDFELDVMLVIGRGHGVMSGRQVGGAEGLGLACGTRDCVGAGSGDPARIAAGLTSSATNPARRTVAATAPRRAALIGRAAAAEEIWGTSD